MTNYEPIKNKIWDSVKNDNRTEFNQQCEALKEKAVGDWWRIGWEFCPKSVEEVIELLEHAGNSAHEGWLKAMDCGDAPPEDVSPGESFQRAADLIKELVNANIGKTIQEITLEPNQFSSNAEHRRVQFKVNEMEQEKAIEFCEKHNIKYTLKEAK